MISAESQPLIEEDPFYFIRQTGPILELLPECQTNVNTLVEILLENKSKISSNFFTSSMTTLASLLDYLVILNSVLDNQSFDASKFQTKTIFSSMRYQDINIFFLEYCMGLISTLVRQLITPYSYLGKPEFDESQQELAEVLISRLNLLLPMIDSAAAMSKEDILCQDPTSLSLLEFKKSLIIRELGSPEQLAAYRENMISKTRALSATAYFFRNKPETCLNRMRRYTTLIYYLRHPAEAARYSVLQSVQGGPNGFKFIDWMDKSYFQSISLMLIPKIEFNEVIYIPKEYPIISKEKAAQAVKNGVWANPESTFFSKEEYGIYKKTLSFNSLKQYRNKSVQVRVLSPVKLTPGSSTLSPIDKVIFHIHGGGFTSMSSKSHQMYTRKWAIANNAVVFSIDYRLAPENPYPAAIDDCWQVYNWVLENCEKTIGVKPNHLVVVGDSAGGNLTIALNLIVAKEGRRKPDGFLSVYPSLNYEKLYFSPSSADSVNYEFMARATLVGTRKAYTADYEGGDPLVSPLIAPDAELAKFPTCRLVATEVDPNHDCAIRFGYRLHLLKKDVKILCFKGLLHGILNLDVPKVGTPEASAVVKECSDVLKELLSR